MTRDTPPTDPLHRPVSTASSLPLNPSPRDLVALYLRHTRTADPPADNAATALAQLTSDRAALLTALAVENPSDLPSDTPDELYAFLETIPSAPEIPLHDTETRAARRAFHSQSDLFIPAFFAATLRNASTAIALSFHATGAVTSDRALRRIRHNTHHFYEIMLPGSLDPGADGWKLSLRIRLIHAHVRHRLLSSGQWDPARYGPPLNAAHLALASANFSASILRDAARLGAVLTPRARRGYMKIWHRASRLIGVPAELLFDADEPATRRFAAAAHACEPPPSLESIEISHALVNAIPAMSTLTDPAAARDLAHRTFRVSRALLGDPLANALRFPPSRTLGLLPFMRLQRHLTTASHALSPRRRRDWQAHRTAFLLDHAVLPSFDYRFPRSATPSKGP